MSKSSKFVAGAIFGAALGSILALLYAPKSGAELQKEIKEKADQVMIEVKKAAAKKEEELNEEINSLNTKD